MRQVPGQLVFSREEALRAGWTDSALARAVRSGRLVRLRRGFFMCVDADRERAEVIAAVRDISGSAASHHSALRSHALPIVGRRPPLPEVTVPPSGRGSAHGVLLHRASMGTDDMCIIDGIPVLNAARTVIDVGRSRPVASAVAAIDAALYRGMATPDELDEVLLRCWNWPGIRRAQRAVRLSDARSESPLESISRLVLRRLRLPKPDLQPVVLDQHGRQLGRLDFYWDEFGVAGEADGRSKYDAREVLIAEKERQELLEDCGLVFVRWGWDAPTSLPYLLKARVEAAFERGLARDRSGFPRLWSVMPSDPATRRENVIAWTRNR
jgi:hypothetical protein